MIISLKTLHLLSLFVLWLNQNNRNCKNLEKDIQILIMEQIYLHLYSNVSKSKMKWIGNIPEGNTTTITPGVIRITHMWVLLAWKVKADGVFKEVFKGVSFRLMRLLIVIERLGLSKARKKVMIVSRRAVVYVNTKHLLLII